MGIDRVDTTLPAYTSLQRDKRPRRGPSTGEDDAAEQSHQKEDQGKVQPDVSDDEVNRDSNEGHIDEHV